MNKKEFRYHVMKLILEYYRTFPGAMVTSKVMNLLDELDDRFDKENVEFKDFFKLQKIEDEK